MRDAGDVNGDGIGDLIVGTLFADVRGMHYVGQSYVIYGRDTAHAGNFPAQIFLASLLSRQGGDGSIGFVLNGSSEAESAGTAVSGAGDLNNDGIDDLVIGTRSLDGGGHAYVVFGRREASED